MLVINADSRTMNPDLPAAFVAQAFEDDPAHAAAEYGQDGKVSFRTDVELFVSLEVVEACRIPQRFELQPEPQHSYVAFTDPSGGSSDSFTLCVAHLEGGDVVIDALRERPSPFDPDSSTADPRAP